MKDLQSLVRQTFSSFTSGLTQGQAAQSRLIWVAGVFVYLVLMIPYVQFGAGYNYNEGVYWATLGALERGAKLYSEVFWSQFPFLIYWEKLGYDLWNGTLAGARYSIAVLSILGSWALYSWGTRRVSPVFGVFAGLIHLFQSTLFHGAHTTEGNVPAVGLALLALNWIDQERGKKLDLTHGLSPRLLGAGIALGLALQVKLIVAGYAGVVVALFMIPAKQQVPFLERAIQVLLVGTVSLTVFAGIWYLTDPGLLSLTQLNGGALASRVQSGAESTLNYTFFEKWGVLFKNDWNYHRGNWLIPIGMFLAAVWPRPQRTQQLVYGFSFSFLVLLPVFLHSGAWPSHFAVISPVWSVCWAYLAMQVISHPKKLFWLTGIVGVAAIWELALILLPVPKLKERVETHFWVDYRGVVETLHKEVPKGSVVITDDQFVLMTAGYRMPHALVDSSWMRMRSRSLTCAMIISEMERSEVQAILVARAFRKPDCGWDNLRQAIVERFPRAQAFGGEIELFLRP